MEQAYENLQLILVLALPFLFVLLCGRIIAHAAKRNGEGIPYACPNCGKHFRVSANTIRLATATYRVLRCPHCGIEDSCRQVTDEE